MSFGTGNSLCLAKLYLVSESYIVLKFSAKVTFGTEIILNAKAAFGIKVKLSAKISAKIIFNNKRTYKYIQIYGLFY
jgi:hypothetical protein